MVTQKARQFFFGANGKIAIISSIHIRDKPKRSSQCIHKLTGGDDVSKFKPKEALILVQPEF